MQQRTGVPAPDQSALAELYQRHVLTLLAYIKRYIASREDAEDILVEVFLAAHERSDLIQIREDEQLAWLRRVAYNKCADLLRSLQRHPTIALSYIEDNLYEPDEHSPEQLALRSEEHSLLRSLLIELPTQQQTVLYLKFGQRLSGVEIARYLKKSESSVSMLLARALNQLRKVYSSKKGAGIDEQR